ncbi:MAG: hypothetical protein A2163_07945 [Actinobacteria bacterium RBG_13_35_12]|nr:MAG: hypothetical protein A2163_07945 [Actinobacteria bacterium RBG_13_35_12]
MAKVREALKPKFNINLAVDEAIKKTDVTDEERQLYHVSQTAGWRILEDFIQEQIDGLDAINAKAMEAGQNFEEIGKNTIVANLAKDVIRRILNKVKDAKEAVERPDGTTKQ